MKETELIRKIQTLKQIQPDRQWVVLTKSRILGETKEASIWEKFEYAIPGIAGQYRLAMASLVVFGVLVFGFGLAQSALPGDLFYPLKKISEQARTVFVSSEDLPKTQLETANRRLEELGSIAESNKVRNLAPAINEFKESVSQAAGNLRKVKDSPRFVREIVGQVQKLEEKKGKIEAMGVVIGESEELNQALAQMVENEIKDLESRSLTEEQTEILSQAKTDFEAGNYSQALEKVLKIQPTAN